MAQTKRTRHDSRVLLGDTKAFSSTIAQQIGLNEAIFIQQVYYWMTHNKQDRTKKHTHNREGRWWVYNTFDQWKEDLPWWSVRTIKRICSKLEEGDRPILISRKFGEKNWKQLKWYTLDFDALNDRLNNEIPESANLSLEECQSVTPNHDKSAQCLYTETTNKDYLQRSQNIEDAPTAQNEFFENSNSDSHEEELPKEVSGQNNSCMATPYDLDIPVDVDGPKRKSSAKKKKVAKPKLKAKLGAVNSNGYLTVPTKGKYAACGALTLALMQCDLISRIDGIQFEDRGDRVMADLQFTYLDGYGEFESGYIYSESFVLRELPLGLIQNLNDSHDNRLFDFSVDWYNERLSFWWNQIVMLVNGGRSIKAMNDQYRNRIFALVFKDHGYWRASTEQQAA